MLKEIKKLIRGNFIKNVTLLASGTAAAQLITVVSSPIITRIYGPESFGILGVFTAITAILARAAALTYPIAIVLPKEQEKAKNLIKLSLIISLILAILLYSLLIFSKKTIVQAFNIESIEPYLFLIPLFIIFAAMVQVSEQWLIRMSNFGIAAKVMFYHSFLSNGSKILVGLFFPVATALIIISTFGNLIKSLMMTYFSLGKSLRISRNELKVKKDRILSVAKEYSDFPKFRAPQELINAASQSLPIMMLSAFFGPTAAGFYSIGITVLKMPAQLIGKSVGDVFYPRISKASFESQKMTPLIKKATWALILIGFFPFGVVILFGPQLFEFVFGNGWFRAGEYASWIAFASYFSFINRPSVRALPVLKAQRFHLFHEIVSVLIRASALVIGFFIFKDDIIAIILFSASGVVLSIFMIIYSLILSRRFDKYRGL